MTRGNNGKEYRCLSPENRLNYYLQCSYTRGLFITSVSYAHIEGIVFEWVFILIEFGDCFKFLYTVQKPVNLLIFIFNLLFEYSDVFVSVGGGFLDSLLN